MALSNLLNSADSSTISFAYDNEDKVTSRTYPNGVTPSYSYFDNDDLKRITDTGPSGPLFDRQYIYNSARQISQIIEPSRSRTFGYDNVDRLTSVTDATNGNESYTFDDVGNRTASHRSATYGYQPFNKLISTATGSYTFDGNGNTVSKSEGSKRWMYVWDYENRLTKGWDRKTTVRYIYDALGRRVQRYAGSESTKFVYDGQDVIADDNAGTLTKYQNGPGIDNKLRAQTGTDAKYFLADHLGSTNGPTDSTGALTSQTAYDSFGNQTGNLATRYGFTGRERDDFTGLMYYRARFYDPNLGRLISEDPIGFGGGDVNLYGYVWNNPQGYSDPFGHYPVLHVPRGSVVASWMDEWLGVAQDFYGVDPPIGWDPLTNQPRTFFGTASGTSDMLRVGSGAGYALYAPDENMWGRAAFCAMDVGRFSGLFTTMAAPFAGGSGSACCGGKGLGTNPFKGKSPPELDQLFRNKGYQPRGPDPMNGQGTYVNPNNGRGYHIDANHPPPKGPHVGAHRPRDKRATMAPRDYPLQ